MPGYQPDATLIAFYSTGLEGREDDGLHLRRADGTAYVARDDAFVLDFYAAHVDDADADLVAAVLSNEQMWGQDLTAGPRSSRLCDQRAGDRSHPWCRRRVRCSSVNYVCRGRGSTRSAVFFMIGGATREDHPDQSGR